MSLSTKQSLVSTLFAGLIFSSLGCQPNVVTDSFDPARELNQATQTLNASVHYSGTGVGGLLGGDTKKISAPFSLPAFPVQIRSYDKTTHEIVFVGLFGIPSWPAMTLALSGETHALISTKPMDTTGYPGCNLSVKDEIFVQFHDSNKADAQQISTITIRNTTTDSNTNCVKYFQENLKTDPSLQNLRDQGILDPSKLDQLQSISIETTSTLTSANM